MNSIHSRVKQIENFIESKVSDQLHLLTTATLPLTYISLQIISTFEIIPNLKQLTFGAVTRSAYISIYYIYGKLRGAKYFYSFLYDP